VYRVDSLYPALRPEDFLLFEGNRKQSAETQLQQFRDTGLGLALIVALDASGSMKGRPLAAIQKGLLHLVERKRQQDKVAVLSFADDNRWEAKWDASDNDLKNSFQNLRGRGHLTRLYDAMEFAIDEFARASSERAGFPLRRCILVVSDGHDEGSRATLGQLQAKIKASRVRLDSVGLANTTLWFGSLRQVSQAAFGEFRAARSPDGLEAILGSGIDGLLDMPVVKFKDEKLTADGQTHELAVEYTPSATRDAFQVKFPKAVLFTTKLWYEAAAAAGAVIILLAAWFIFAAKRKKPSTRPIEPMKAEAVAPAPAERPTKPSGTVNRPATITESNPTFTNLTSGLEPVIQYAQATNSGVAAKPARQPTTLAPQEQTRASKVELLAISGPYAGQGFEIKVQEFWIGSASNNHLCLSADPSVSGNHACIRTEQPFFRLFDNGSLNKTWVNGRAIDEEAALIRLGDHIQIGQSEFRIEARA
jgi:hypothetical protein